MAEIFSSAPLLSEFRAKGGTFITMSSAVRDSSLLFSNDNIRMSFSKFACLKIPNWENVTTQSLFFDGSTLQPSNTDPNLVLPKAIMQNYVENLIQYSEGSRTNDNFKNYAESAFFKALKSVEFGGTTPDNAAQAMQMDPTIAIEFDDYSGQNVQVFKELNDGGYEKVVKYVGDVNLINHVKSAGNEYTEVYVHVPTEAGYQDEILFYPNTKINHDATAIPSAGGDQDSVVGLEDFKGTDQVEPVYDTVDFKYNVNSDIDKLGIWFDDLESDETVWNKGDFDFNCVLLYYDLFDKDDQTTIERNLYGVLFLDRLETSGGGFTIAPLEKFMPDAQQPGNSFGFRFNLKFSAQSNQVTSEITINDYNTISMELYMEALRRLQNVTDQYGELEEIILTQQAQIDKINELLLTDIGPIRDGAATIADNTKRIQSLESSRDRIADVRITNEDLFRLFQETVDAIKSGDSVVTNTIIMTAKAMLPTLIDQDLIILEDTEGTRYQWDETLQDWVIIP